MKPDLSIEIGGIKLQNPVMLASGTAGYGEDISKYCNLNRIGAIIVKGIALKSSNGNPPPRICETPSDMLNATRLPNVGLGTFINEKVPFLRNFDTRLIVKLSPNVTDIASFAKVCEEEGADAVSLINTLIGMVIDTETWRPKLANITGGLSGPAIRPVAVRMVWQAYNAVTIPIIGMGGITNYQDAVEFFLAGASAVAIGTANFLNPSVSMEITDGLTKYMVDRNISNMGGLTGMMQVS